jgi:hypothetical protein
MAQQSRANLKSFFQTGFKPTQQNFADFVDSASNRQDDGIEADNLKNVTIAQGITIKNSSLETPGTIRWNGTNFQFRDSTSWKDLGFGSSSQWTTVGTDINLLTGLVGIGLAAATAPTAKLEIRLGNTAISGSNPTGTAAPADMIKVGNAAIFADSFTAYFSHKSKAAVKTFALSQDTFGSVGINAAPGQTISFLEDAVVRATFVGGVLSIGNPPVTAGSVLTLNGNAAKTVGGATWLTASDERLKTDISPFKDGLALLKKVNPVNFQYNGKAGIAPGKENVGLLAQEVAKVFPYMVDTFKAKLNESDTEETELLSLDVNALTFVLVNAVKEMDARLTKLEGKKK